MPYVTDTHSLIWYLTDDPKLSGDAKKIFRRVDNFQDEIFIPCIVFFELIYLIEKNKIVVDFESLVTRLSSSQNYRIEPLCLPIIEKSRSIRREKVSDPWDRLIAATSMHLSVPLISKDDSFREIGLEVIW